MIVLAQSKKKVKSWLLSWAEAYFTSQELTFNEIRLMSKTSTNFLFDLPFCSQPLSEQQSSNLYTVRFNMLLNSKKVAQQAILSSRSQPQASSKMTASSTAQRDSQRSIFPPGKLSFVAPNTLVPFTDNNRNSPRDLEALTTRSTRHLSHHEVRRTWRDKSKSLSTGPVPCPSSNLLGVARLLLGELQARVQTLRPTIVLQQHSRHSRRRWHGCSRSLGCVQEGR